MTATLYWRPETNSGTALTCAAPSAAWEILERSLCITGADFIILDRLSLPLLQGIAAALPAQRIWEELRDAVKNVGTIRVYREY